MFINTFDAPVTNKNLPSFWCNAFLHRNVVNEPSNRGHKFFMSAKIPDETFLGKTFNYWTILTTTESVGKNKVRMVEAKCICGNIKIIALKNILRGMSKSCGCKKLEMFLKSRGTHGLSRSTQLYRVYIDMKARCYNKNSPAYKYYGGRGIIICDEWLNYFVAFYDWSMSHGYRKGLTIDRHPNKLGNYEPSNCRWGTWKIQSRNRTSNHEITLNGETKILIEWAEQYGIAPTTLDERLKNGWTVERAITEPVQEGFCLTLNGETKTLFQWSKDLSIDYSTLHSRVKRWGNDAEKVLTYPIEEHQRSR